MKEKMDKLKEYVRKNGKYVFPVIICLAVAVTVVIALRAGGVHSDELNQIGETTISSESIVETSSTAEENETALVKNEDPEIEKIIGSYYKALADGDSDAINAVCDKVDEMNMLWFVEISNYIEYYPVLEIYTKPGFEAGETIAYVCFKVKLTGKEAEYPGYKIHYVCTAEDGSLYIKRTNLSNDADEYVQKVSEEADVLELINRVKVEFEDLMAEQPDLLAYMDDVSEDVRKVVGLELGNQKGEASTGETETQTPDGGEGEGQGEGSNPGQNVEQQVEEVVYAVASTTVNVRISDSEKAEKIGRVTGGTKVEVLAQLENGWSKIKFENKEGYIMSKYLKVQESALKYTPIGTVKATDNINVRADASTDSSKIGTLVKGDEVDLLAVEGEWCKINFKGQIAYVKAEYVERQQ